LVGGGLTVAAIMSPTLSVNHPEIERIQGANLLNAFKGNLGNPMTMLA
jgi:hypothetical protein